MNISKKIFLSLILILTTSCVETMVVGSFVAGSVATREKTIVDTKDDAIIATKLYGRFVQNGLKNIGENVDITVNEGRVLLTGVVREKNKEKLAIDLAWKVDKRVKEVISEIKFVNESLKPKDISRTLADYFLILEIEAKFLAKSGVSSTNYKITVVDGVVYLIGVASGKRELDYVLNIVSRVRGVKKVVNYVILENDSRRR